MTPVQLLTIPPAVPAARGVYSASLPHCSAESAPAWVDRAGALPCSQMPYPRGIIEHMFDINKLTVNGVARSAHLVGMHPHDLLQRILSGGEDDTGVDVQCCAKLKECRHGNVPLAVEVVQHR